MTILDKLMKTITLVLALTICTSSYSEESLIEDGIDGLCSQNMKMRAERLSEIENTYNDLKKESLEALEYCAHNYINNNDWNSPLHCSILAIIHLRLYEAENDQFSIIDYKIDTLCVPFGIRING